MSKYTYDTASHLTKEEYKKQAAVYTPQIIAEMMAKKFTNIPKEYDPNFSIIDPCCGTGNLLAAVLNVWDGTEFENEEQLDENGKPKKMSGVMRENNIYGADIDAAAIQKCREKFPHGHFQVYTTSDGILDEYEDFTDDDFWFNKAEYDKKYKQRVERAKTKKRFGSFC
jgi:type I restriction-modification system DNA methylase subunit